MADDQTFNAVPGAAIGPYVLEQRLGSGGFGTVWRARDPESGHTVAIKVLHDRYAGEDAQRARAEIEALAAAAASRSEHVVRVLGGGMQPVPHIVMEYVEGTNLRDEIARRGRLSQRETVRVGRAIADALAAAEAEGIVHRDVKSANVLLDLDRAVRLGDFGTAKIAGYSSGSILGQAVISKEYSAPEIWNFLEATTRSDLYSLGIVLFECLAGRPPFTGSMPECKLQHETREPDYSLLPSDTVEPLRRLIASCLAKDPAGRTGSAAAVIEALDEAEGSLRVAPQQKHEPTSLEHWVIHSRHPSRPRTFRCVHDTTGQRATVEVHFADDPAYAMVLERARQANAALIPFGAERLLGANRLLLRIDEEWPEPQPARFMFWVAREELPVPGSPGSVDAALLAKAVDGLLALRQAAEAQGLDLAPEPGDLTLLSDGSLYLQRPGLPPAGPPGDTGMLAFLAALPLEPGPRVAVAAATTLEEFRDALEATVIAPALPEEPEEPRPVPAPPIPIGEAIVIDHEGGSAPGDTSDRSSTILPPVLPPDETDGEPPDGDEQSAPPAPEEPAFGPSPEAPTERHPRRVVLAMAGIAVLAALGAMLVYQVTGGDGDDAGKAAVEASVTVVGPSTTATATPSSTPPPIGKFPARTAVSQRDQCGGYTVVREAQAANARSTSVTILAPDGSVALQPHPRDLTLSYDVAWCGDIDLDGNMEIDITQHFDTTGPCCQQHQVYRLGTKAEEVFSPTQGDLLDLEPQATSGGQPYLLVGTDYRLWGIFDALPKEGPALAVVFRWKDGRYEEATRAFPDVVRARRDARAGSIDCPTGQYDSFHNQTTCLRSAAIGLMADSLVVGDWEAYRSKVPLPEEAIGWAESQRPAVEKLMAGSPRYDLGGLSSLRDAARPVLSEADFNLTIRDAYQKVDGTGLYAVVGQCRTPSSESYCEKVFFFSELAGKLALIGTDTFRNSRQVLSVWQARRDNVPIAGSFAVDYGAYQPGDPVCCPQGRATVTYHWNGSAFDPDGVPPDFGGATPTPVPATATATRAATATATPTATPTSTPAKAFQLVKQVTVLASSSVPLRTGVTVNAGQRVRLTATGIWCVGGNFGNPDCRGPDGLRPANSVEPDILVAGANMGALVGRLGDTGGWFYVGPSAVFTAGVTTDLQLVMNDRAAFYFDNSGSVEVNIELEQ